MDDVVKFEEESLHRRTLFFTCNAALILIGAIPFAHLLAFQGWTVARTVSMVLFVLLLIPVVYGFTTAATGFWLLWRRGGDPLRINKTTDSAETARGGPRTAVVMPIYNENVPDVFRRLRAMYFSLKAAGRVGDFHFFILSDSSDATTWIAEEKAWYALCFETGGFGTIFYRKRRVPLHNKCGNIADFSRRWGSSYKYMIVLDADSLMEGGTMARLVGLMDQNPGAGIIQTLPQIILGKTLFQRVWQFGAHLTSGMFSAGMNYWQLGSATYWGHNAIVRLRPFMQYCAMPELPENCPLGRRILSHDTVEAALMRRAGYSVWLAHDLGGSYEEYPPQLMAALRRDSRWCFGNLQHAWVVSTPGLLNASRIHLVNGIMAYLSSPLWMLFLVWSAWVPVVVSDPFLAELGGTPLAIRLTRFLTLFVLSLLFVPKILAVAICIKSSKAAAFGGKIMLLSSTLAETLISMLVAPILMVFHSRFVLAALLGSSVRWGAQQRSASGSPSLKSFVGPYLASTLLGACGAVVAAWRRPGLIPFLAPVLAGLLFSIPFSFWLASEKIGQAARKKRLFLTPQETAPAPVVKAYQESNAPVSLPEAAPPGAASQNGVFAVVIDPLLNRLHASVLTSRTNHNARTRAFRNAAAEKLLTQGIDAVTPFELRTLLWDAELVRAIHLRVWTGASESLHKSWNEALAAYRRGHAQAEAAAV